MKIIQKNLTKDQYYDEIQPKKIIVLHHTAGGSAVSSINWWQQTKERVATSVVIGRDGTIYQAFPFNRWASALGIKQSVFNKYKLANINKRLDQISIQIELANWGGLVEKGGKFYNYVNQEIANKNVTSYSNPYRGFKHYESYSKKQIEALKELILYLHKVYPNISLKYNEDMWEETKRALVGVWGIWTHTSFRADKSDCHPQPELIEMLKSLNK